MASRVMSAGTDPSHGIENASLGCNVQNGWRLADWECTTGTVFLLLPVILASRPTSSRSDSCKFCDMAPSMTPRYFNSAMRHPPSLYRLDTRAANSSFQLSSSSQKSQPQSPPTGPSRGTASTSKQGAAEATQSVVVKVEPTADRLPAQRALPTSTVTYGPPPLHKEAEGDVYVCSDAGGTLYKIQRTRVTAASPKLAQVLTDSEYPGSAGSKRKTTHPELIDGLPVLALPHSDSIVHALTRVCCHHPPQRFANTKEIPFLVRALHNYELTPWLAVLLDGQWATFCNSHPCIALALALSLNWDAGSNAAASSCRKLPLSTIFDPKGPLAKICEVGKLMKVLRYMLDSAAAGCTSIELVGSTFVLPNLTVEEAHTYAFFTCSHTSGSSAWTRVLVGADRTPLGAASFVISFLYMVRERIKACPSRSAVAEHELIPAFVNDAVLFCRKHCAPKMVGDLARFAGNLLDHVERDIAAVEFMPDAAHAQQVVARQSDI